jgi:hypothetical protein
LRLAWLCLAGAPQTTMHTREDLSTADFALTIEGRPATFAELVPGVTPTSRIAIVAHTPAGAFGAAVTLLGLVTYWYGERARAGEDFFEYPDYFYLRVGGGGRADLGQLEIWPAHKQLVVAPRTQQLLEVIEDRAINYLLIEDRAPDRAAVLRETRNALPRHLRGALVYDASGVAARADVAVEGSAAAERHVGLAIDSSAELPPAFRRSARQHRDDITLDGHVTERLRRASLEEAVDLLCYPADPSRPLAAGLDDEWLRSRLVDIGPGAEAVFAPAPAQ